MEKEKKEKQYNPEILISSQQLGISCRQLLKDNIIKENCPEVVVAEDGSEYEELCNNFHFTHIDNSKSKKDKEYIEFLKKYNPSIE